MSLRRTVAFVLVVAIAAGLAGLGAQPAIAESLAEQASADRAALERAAAQYEAAQAESAKLDAQVREASAELDRVIVQQMQCQGRLNARAAAMYRSGDMGTLVLLFSSSSINDLASRLDLLGLMARQDAGNVQELKAARDRARASAEALIELQTEQARKLGDLEQEVARAKQELAGSEAALREYEARVAAAKAAAEAAAKRAAAARSVANPDQQLAGNGEWQTAVASHYSINFTGRGASGETIGPYSMMVAHKTLPLGTLVEIQYNGLRCVARVADRGPFVPGRDFDLGPGVARVLGFSGVHEIQWRIVGQ